jgi:light-regulated signal transduction histidine kinase (bacteriophytochrome)
MSVTVIDPAIDLEACAREPIRTPGGIQPHGALVVLEPKTLEILQASINLKDFLGADAVIGSGLGALNGAAAIAQDVESWARSTEPMLLRTSEAARGPVQILAHRARQGLIVEFEDAPANEAETLEALYPRLRAFVDQVHGAQTVDSLCDLSAKTLRELTGFNRVLIYQFDDDWNGVVVAEDGDGVLPSYLGHRFPASDIPAQARELYRLNPMRIIPDAFYEPAPIEPARSPVDGAPLDLSLAALRSVSPVHLEYMRNMGTGASMSVSILRDGQLWGLASCHNHHPKLVNAQARTACDFLGQILSMQIAARERSTHAAELIELKRIEAGLLTRLTGAASFQSSLTADPQTLLDLTRAAGAALYFEGKVQLMGETPPEATVIELAEWLGAERDEPVFVTDHLASLWPAGAQVAEQASGVLAVSISQIHPSYIFWFRPEVVQTVTWGGQPAKAVEPLGGRLHPRKSFAAWKEQVRMHSAPWRPAEVEVARDFRSAVLTFVMQRAEERAELTDELQRANKELEAFSYSISHDLRAPFRHIVGYAELLSERETALNERSRHYLDSIIDAALQAGRLVDDLLNFSQLGRAQLMRTRVDLNKAIDEIIRSYDSDLAGRKIEWKIAKLPIAWGDGSLLRQAMTNLIDNALKYSRDRDPAVITIDGEEREDDILCRVADNGAGFDMRYVAKLFGVFQRLHRVDDFPGTGIGLALTKRIIDRHGGRIWAEGEVDRGATFFFTLPKRTKDLPNG